MSKHPCSTILAQLCLIGLLALSGCQSEPPLPVLPSPSSAVYRLGSGDHVRLIVYGQPQLTGEFIVSAADTISVPLVGTISTAGQTTDGLQDEVAHALERKAMIREPSVSVELVQYRPIFVLGEVSHAGQYSYQPGMTVLSAVSSAGGFTYRAIKSYAMVVRTEGNQRGHAVKGRLGADAYLQPGDVVTIYQRYF